ncbi:hypothetical protein BCR42DRAFT_399042 [Absidia repens]|uniref:Uncharacterized protein n=1 Tax=Absidia repens TaxID=90262 RepID=A0A1X2HK72_9FUNG|nr:hypothetical protein BCR42DRAFT_399042 [Absidia repens]
MSGDFDVRLFQEGGSAPLCPICRARLSLIASHRSRLLLLNCQGSQFRRLYICMSSIALVIQRLTCQVVLEFLTQSKGKSIDGDATVFTKHRWSRLCCSIDLLSIMLNKEWIFVVLILECGELKQIGHYSSTWTHI